MVARVLIGPIVIQLAWPSALAGQSIRGRIFDLASGSAVGGAEVTLAASQKRAVANDRGEFRIAGVPAGSQRLHLRHVGHRDTVVTVAVPAQGEAIIEIVLSRVVTLDTVAVQASAELPDFEEHRRIGLGRFMTRAELEKQHVRKLAEILEQIGVRTVRHGSRAWVGGPGRGPRSISPHGTLKCSQLEGRGVDNEDDPRTNPGCGCFAQVYLDDALLYNGESGGIIPDINLISASSLEAVEYYKGPAQTPAKYSRLNSRCGVLVLHTRR